MCNVFRLLSSFLRLQVKTKEGRTACYSRSTCLSGQNYRFVIQSYDGDMTHIPRSPLNISMFYCLKYVLLYS